MSPPNNREEPLIRRLARSKALNSRNASRDASMSPTRYENCAENIQNPMNPRSSSQPPNYHAGSYFTNEKGQILQYVPCTFIYPNDTNASLSLPSLNVPSLVPEALKQQINQYPQQKLSKLSNLCWTTSVSQPDLTRPIGTPIMSPSNSLPTSRASSPVPPSISARGSPGNGPSPHVSPMGSGLVYNQDINHLNAALNQLSLTQGYIYPPQHPRTSSNTAELRNANLQPLQDLNGNQATYQVHQSGQLPTLLSSNLHNMTPKVHNVTSVGQPQDKTKPNGLSASGQYMIQPDKNVWYCQYVSVPNSESMNLNQHLGGSPIPTEQIDRTGKPMHNEKRGNSSSPKRSVSLSIGGAATNVKPCAVIAPHLVQTQASKNSKDRFGLNTQSTPTTGGAFIRNSSPVPSIKVDNEFGLSSSAPAHNQCWTFQTTAADTTDEFVTSKQNFIERSQATTNNSGSCPDINYTVDTLVSTEKRSIGTSCTDLEKPVPFVVETCQICNLFHPQSLSKAEEASLGNPYFTYSPCLYGHKIIKNRGISQMSEGEHCKSPKEFSQENTNKLDNRPDKFGAVKQEGGLKVQTVRQETNENVKMERIKSASGAGQGSIDNRIEQAMDLVKSHLMSAVRSEVEELRDKISKLEDTVTILSRENEILRANVNPEVLASLTGNRNLVGGMNSISNVPPDPSHPALQPPNQH